MADGDEQDDYWNDSRVSTKSKSIWNDEENMADLSAMKAMKSSLKVDMQEDVIGWDDTPAVTVTPSAVTRPRADSRSLLDSRPLVDSRPRADSRTTLPPAPQTPPSQGGFTASLSQIAQKTTPLPSPFPEPKESFRPKTETPKQTAEAASILAAIDRPSPAGGNSQQQFEKLKRDNDYLKRRINELEKPREPAVEEAIKKIIRGEPFSLDLFRSLAQKLELLDKAIATGDGDAIIAAVLFLRRTVKSNIFNRELTRRSVAVDQYICFLKQHSDYSELADLYAMMGRFEESAFVRYKIAINTSNPQMKVKNLENCRKTDFDGFPQEAELIRQQIRLLERQQPIEAADVKADREGKQPMFQAIPRNGSLIDKSVLTTLYYCCLYHFEEPENLLSSPVAIKKEHMLNDKQFMWQAVSARSRACDWKRLEELFLTKNFIGRSSMRSIIPWEKVCDVLFRTSAPLDQLSKYLRLIENHENRLHWAKAFKVHGVIVETLVAAKNRSELERYAASLKPGSPELRSAQDALQSSTIKWKT